MPEISSTTILPLVSHALCRFSTVTKEKSNRPSWNCCNKARRRSTPWIRRKWNLFGLPSITEGRRALPGIRRPGGTGFRSNSWRASTKTLRRNINMLEFIDYYQSYKASLQCYALRRDVRGNGELEHGCRTYDI